MELEPVIVDDNLALVNIKLKTAILKRTDDGETGKILFGIKFAPKENLSKENYEKALEHINSGSFLVKSGKFNDFISVKISKPEVLGKLIEEFSKAMRILYRENMEDFEFKNEDELKEFLLSSVNNAFAKQG
ncbi:MAG: hypothetical protein QXO57_02595 [Candidatus Aenigmatarchaeota archaeon]